MGKLLFIIGLIALSLGWWRQLLVLFEGGEFVVETRGGVDLRGREKRWRDGMLITDTTCRVIIRS